MNPFKEIKSTRCSATDDLTGLQCLLPSYSCDGNHLFGKNKKDLISFPEGWEEIKPGDKVTYKTPINLPTSGELVVKSYPLSKVISITVAAHHGSIIWLNQEEAIKLAQLLRYIITANQGEEEE